MPKDMAAVELEQLQQGNRSAEEFIQEFNQITRHLNYGEEVEIQYFKKGLNPALIKQIYNVDHLPISLCSWQEKAIALD